ncbi:MaoC/PaaZ C-terminal domain-containing protein [Rhizobium sp. L1K21]|uniref:MaoC/PaaZ C-terminal domain-containing protein n=1 Tax=Rhizobium sp. L1K21 TaxID=2954933 RepID=UPI002093F3FE|nr:MaoC/PaaZ C-terminal domain-containing protein [Rhizobium sp. L1K21]MCO6185455.1 dehydratase [Rhizobium sp. L1K21]
MMMKDMTPVGEPVVIGSYTFSEADIVRFARKFDPQYFHTDPERAKESVLGGLCASGWHVCSAWMQVNLKFLFAEFAKLAAAGKAPPKMGPAMGFRDLKWLKPVYAGDTVTYSNTFLSQTDAPAREDRVINEILCEGVNQRGEKVISFIPRVVEFK